MIIIDLLLWVAGLGLASDAWDTGKSAYREFMSGGSRARQTSLTGLTLFLPAILCWATLLQRVAIRLAPPPGVAMASQAAPTGSMDRQDRFPGQWRPASPAADEPETPRQLASSSTAPPREGEE